MPIELPVEVKKVLSNIQISLQQHKLSWVKWVAVKNIHLTLKFLGNVSTTKIGSITTIIDDLSYKTNPFSLQLGSLGAFPNLKNPQVLWIGIKGEIKKLINIQQSLDSELAKLSFPPETRPYQPHLTLARLRNQATRMERQSLGDLLPDMVIESDCGMKVDSIYLIRSELTRNGPIYHELHSAHLA
jgi:2'-5' RNA ligase